MNESTIRAVAVLIDGENIEAKYADQIFAKADSIGTVVAKHIYGAGFSLSEWSTQIYRYAIEMKLTMQPSRYKNSSDLALVIGAMELLYRGTGKIHETPLDTFLIVSSDSDFSLLAHKLRAENITVVGLGGPDNVNPIWPSACSEFYMLEEVNGQTVDESVAVNLSNHGSPSHGSSINSSQNHNSQNRSTPTYTYGDTRHTTIGNTARMISRTYEERVENIRAFIIKNLGENNGQIHSARLFKLLNDLPDYEFDQKRSKKDPDFYLRKEYGDCIRFVKHSDGSLWVHAVEPSIHDSSASINAGSVTHAGSAENDDNDTVGNKNDTLDNSINTISTTESTTESKQGAGPRDNHTNSSQKASSMTAAEAAEMIDKAKGDFITHCLMSGIDKDISYALFDLCKSSPNLRIVYNEVRKQYGNTYGRNYFQVIKNTGIMGK